MYAGVPTKTQARLKQIVDSQYKPTPDGLVGNDDLGQMSAWLFFTAMGFYPVAPASNQYVLGRPFVDRAVLHLPNGKSLVIASENMTEDQAFLKDVLLNGKSLDRSYVTHQELMQGGELRFVFSSEKDAEWSHRKLRAPFSETQHTNAPVFNCLPDVYLAKSSGLTDQRRRRKTGDVSAQRRIRRIAHRQFQRAAIRNLRVAKPHLIERLAVQPNALHVFVVVRIVARDNHKVLAILQVNRRLVEDRAAQRRRSESPASPDKSPSSKTPQTRSCRRRPRRPECPAAYR